VNIDRKPPRLAAGERETLMTLWQYQRESVVRKVEGLDTDSATRRLVESGTTLLWLVRHLARAESLWILGRFAGEPSQVPDLTTTPSRPPLPTIGPPGRASMAWSRPTSSTNLREATT